MLEWARARVPKVRMPEYAARINMTQDFGHLYSPSPNLALARFVVEAMINRRLLTISLSPCRDKLRENRFTLAYVQNQS